MLGGIQNFGLEILNLEVISVKTFRIGPKCAKGKLQEKILQSVVNLKLGKPCTECRMYAVHY